MGIRTTLAFLRRCVYHSHPEISVQSRLVGVHFSSQSLCYQHLPAGPRDAVAFLPGAWNGTLNQKWVSLLSAANAIIDILRLCSVIVDIGDLSHG